MNNLDDSKIFAYQILDPELFPVSIKKINILNES